MFQAHIQKNHGGKGSVIHDTNLKPKIVSPPPPEVTTEIQFEASETIENHISSMEIDNEEHNEFNKILDEENLEEERYFHCPYCDNFKSENQLVIGDHVVINHSKEHIARNAKPPETQECPICHKKVNSVNLLQNHVRFEHPDVDVM